jgi:hypothetical protein
MSPVANWSNVRLIVVGPPRHVERFRKLARPYVADAKKPPPWLRRGKRQVFDPPDPLFTPDMLHGEGGDLFEEPVRRIGRHRLRAEYKFQARNDDGVEHFSDVSLRFPDLRFLVVWGDPNADSFGSAYVRNGAVTAYEVGDRRRGAIYNRHRREYGREFPDDDDDLFEWDAFSEMMDVAENRWRSVLMPRQRRVSRSRRR